MIRIFFLLALCAAALGNVVRFNCGGPEINNIGFRADDGTYRSAGSVGFTTASPITTSGGSWGPVYESHAVSFNFDLVYTFPVPNGEYNVFLLFAETWNDAVAGTRQFSVAINGDTKIAQLDVFTAAGGTGRSLFLPYQATVTGQTLTVTLGKIAGKNNPMISGIVISALGNNDPTTFIDGTAPQMTTPSPSASVPATVTVPPSVSASASPPPSTSAEPSVTASTAASVSSTPVASVSSSLEASVSSTPAASATSSAVPTTSPSPLSIVAADCIPMDFQLNVGGPAVGSYAADDPALLGSFKGLTFSHNAVVDTSAAESAPAVVYNTERFAPGTNMFTFSIPTQGDFPVTVVTHHLESFFDNPGQRVFGITINGQSKITMIDLITEGGKNVAVNKVFADEVPQNGVVTIGFVRETENPQINGIRVFRTCSVAVATESATPSPSASVASSVSATPSPSASVASSVSATPSASASIASSVSATPSPSASVLASQSATASAIVSPTASGVVPSEECISFSMNVGSETAVGEFAGDNPQFIVGGTTAFTNSLTVAADVANIAPTGVYNSERITFGPLYTYNIPVTGPGPYTVTTFHAETFFGVSSARVFNILINGQVAKASLDVFNEVGMNAGFAQVFSDVTPIAGTISVGLQKVTQNPLLNAIRIEGVGIGDIANGVGCSAPAVVPTVSVAPTVTPEPTLSPSISATPSVSAEALITPTASSSISVSPSASASVSVVPSIFTPSPVSVPNAFTCAVSGRTPDTFSMNIGSSAAVGDFGAENDVYRTGVQGAAFSTQSTITPDAAGIAPAALYSTERVSFGAELTYSIPVSGPGPYTVTTLHSETFNGGVGERLFNIVINGEVVKASLDIFAEAGMNVGLAQVFPNISPNLGMIEIVFTKVTENPQVNGIRISGVGADLVAVAGGCDPISPVVTPSESPSASASVSAAPSASKSPSATIVSPVATMDVTVTPSPSVTPSSDVSPVPVPTLPVDACPIATAVTGRIDANTFAMNVGAGASAELGYGGDNVNYITSTNKGATFVSQNPISGSEGVIFQSQRFTNGPDLTYKIPMPVGTYSVTLYHSETFFNEPEKRVFDVSINGNTVNENLDVFTYTGMNAPFKMTYSNIASVNGEITIALLDKTNNPMLSAIRIEGPGAGTIAIAGQDSGPC